MRNALGHIAFYDAHDRMYAYTQTIYNLLQLVEYCSLVKYSCIQREMTLTSPSSLANDAQNILEFSGSLS